MLDTVNKDFAPLSALASTEGPAGWEFRTCRLRAAVILRPLYGVAHGRSRFMATLYELKPSHWTFRASADICTVAGALAWLEDQGVTRNGELVK